MLRSRNSLISKFYLAIGPRIYVLGGRRSCMEGVRFKNSLLLPTEVENCTFYCRGKWHNLRPGGGDLCSWTPKIFGAPPARGTKFFGAPPQCSTWKTRAIIDRMSATAAQHQKETKYYMPLFLVSAAVMEDTPRPQMGLNMLFWVRFES